MVRHHKASRESAGARTLSKELQAKGHRVGRYMARNLMREAGIASRQRRRHKYKSPGVEALVAPHVLKRKFDVTTVNQVWCGVVWRRDVHQSRQAVDVLRRRSGSVRSQDRRLVVLDDF
ncbi:IS3 family transposase [Pseudomonas tolaasii]|uniref:IS3 family transposase n=1 Tax=Pseudomonas tolaasii TaxID=29442 RepID=UPI003BB02293